MDRSTLPNFTPLSSGCGALSAIADQPIAEAAERAMEIAPTLPAGVTSVAIVRGVLAAMGRR